MNIAPYLLGENHLCKKLIILVLLALGASISVAMAGEVAQRQKIFNVDLDLKPNAALQVKQVKGDIPVYVLSDDRGEIVAIQVGTDQQTVRVDYANGKTFKFPVPTAVVRQDWATKKRYQVIASSPLHSRQELFYLDATKIDPQSGGNLILRFPSSLALNTTHEVELKLDRQEERWVASVVEHLPSQSFTEEDGAPPSFEEPKDPVRPIASVKIEESITGIGISAPEFRDLDPNKILEELTVEPLSNVVAVAAHEAKTKELVDFYSAKPIEAKEFDLSVQLQQLGAE